VFRISEGCWVIVAKLKNLPRIDADVRAHERLVSTVNEGGGLLGVSGKVSPVADPIEEIRRHRLGGHDFNWDARFAPVQYDVDFNIEKMAPRVIIRFLEGIQPAVRSENDHGFSR